MAGVVLRVPSLSGTSLAGWAQQLGVAARTLELTVATITQDELETAVVNIKKISPFKSGDFMRAWRVLRLASLSFAVVNLMDYAGWVHRRGEKGILFYEEYAKPEVDAAVRRARVRIKEALRDSVRAQAASSLAPSIRRGILASQLRFALAARRGR